MMTMENKIKQIITTSEIVVRMLVVLFVISLLFFSSDEGILWIKSVGFLMAFMISAYMHKYFFPYTMVAIMFFFFASTNELFGYTDAAFTRILWNIGDVCLLIGMFVFWYRLKYKYKILNDEQIDENSEQ